MGLDGFKSSQTCSNSSNSSKVIHRGLTGFDWSLNLNGLNKDEKIDDNSENIEDARIDFDLFAKMVRHCSRNLMPYSEMLRIYNDACCISKDTGFGINEWVQVCLHFGIYVPVDSKTGRIITMNISSIEEAY